jgi:hypothetical protein
MPSVELRECGDRGRIRVALARGREEVQAIERPIGLLILRRQSLPRVRN